MSQEFEKYIDDVSKTLLENHEGMTPTKAFTHPNKDEIVKLLLQLRDIMFPEYFENKEHYFYSIQNRLSNQLQNILYNLSKQISIVLRYLPQYYRVKANKLESKGQELALEFLKKLKKVQNLIETDLQAAYDGDPAAFNKAEIILSYPGLFAIMTNRIAHELYLLNIPLIPRIMTEYAHTKTGIDIHPGATLGKYFFIDHGTGTVIGETAVIGDNVKIYQGVTIGALSTRGGQKLRGKKRHPTIEDNVVIYANASILGGETTIGHDCIIGGNAFITSSISNNSKVRLKKQNLEYR